MEQFWGQTDDIRIAAACGTMGAVCKLETTYIERTNKKEAIFHISPKAMGMPYDFPRIRRDFQKGTLERTEPAHPFLNILRACENRTRLLDLQQRGIPCHLVPVPGTDLYVYVRSQTGLPGVQGAGEVIQLRCLNSVAAFGLIGLRLLAIDGHAGNHRYSVPRFGPLRKDGSRPDGVRLLSAWNADKESIPWEEPFAQAQRGLYNRQRFVDAIQQDIGRVLLLKPGSRLYRSALVRTDANPAAFDEVKRHFDQE